MINKLNYFILIFVLIVGCDSSNDKLLGYTDYTDDTPWSTQSTCEDYYIKIILTYL